MAPELEQIRREVERITHGWTDTQWYRAPPGKWTTAQIFEHLLLTYTGTTKGLRRALDNGTVTASVSTLPHRVRKFAVTKLGYMPGGPRGLQTDHAGRRPECRFDAAFL